MQLPNITDKQKEIIVFLYRFRFLNRIQIQKLLNNKDHRNINTWLKDLTQKNYITRIYDRKNNTIPAKYYLSINGIKFLRTLPNIEKSFLKKLHQENRRSESFINKSILAADIYLKLKEIEIFQNNDFKFYTQADFPKEAVIRQLLPDFAYVYKIKNNLEHFVGEIFGENMNNNAIRARIKKCLEYFEDDDSPTNIIFVASDDKSLIFIEHLIRKYTYNEGNLNANIYTTTRKQIEQNGMEISLFKKAEVEGL
jgi:hypothetical protein